MVVHVVRRYGRINWKIKKHILFIAPEIFGDTALSQPPYRTVPWYDAKLWQFAVEHWQQGDCIWNVGSVSGDPEAVAKTILNQLTERSN